MFAHIMRCLSELHHRLGVFSLIFGMLQANLAYRDEIEIFSCAIKASSVLVFTSSTHNAQVVRDTISLRRASLKAETIRTLILVTKKLHLDREHANKALKSQISVVPVH
jgi:hypothetical protein